MSFFPLHRDIFIIPPNMPNIIIRQITNKETNPLKAIQRFLELPIKDNDEYSEGRKRFLATRLLSSSTELTAGAQTAFRVTSLFDDATSSFVLCRQFIDPWFLKVISFFSCLNSQGLIMRICMHISFLGGFCQGILFSSCPSWFRRHERRCHRNGRTP